MDEDLFGPAPEKAEKVANEDAIQKVARAIYAMIPRKTKGVLGTINAIRNEAYKRTMSDSYSFSKPPRAGFVRPTAEEKENSLENLLARRRRHEVRTMSGNREANL